MSPLLILGIVIFLLIVFWTRMTVTIPAGHAGILFKTLTGGVELDKTYGEGFTFIAPWNKMFIYETRKMETSETMNVLSSNGLEISVDVSAWYKPVYAEVAKLHADVGVNYLDRIVIPSLRASTRSIIGRYTPEELYSKKRDVIQDEIFIETKKLLASNYIFTDQILVRSIILPTTIKTAIESKLEQEQQSLEYEFKLEIALKEAERQRIEAEGKAAANRIVSASLTDKILKEKGIEATLELAKSPNSKVVVVGSSKDGMPLILGNN
jgi:regulator of protease activity HflC (stomatin/prohibitin superfamily)